jgi:predicted RNA-binding protein with PUA-like domain
MAKKYWLMKSEPDVYSIDDLGRDGESGWSGVRNYQARNFMRDAMKKGDGVIYYHSSCEVPAIAGLAEVSRESYPDPTQFDKKSEYYDPKSTPENPTWMMVSIRFVKKFHKPLTLTELKKVPALQKMMLVQKGSRLSVQPVQPTEWETVRSLTGS